ncbi:MAG: YqaJ viral recombinase family protein [Clostridia bacterium]|nr:YqaJ viral recombinase family protein [Clostridia bacterium]
MAREIIKLKHNTPEWLSFRNGGIGSSDAAAVLGLSKWKTNQDLWEEKTGLRKPKDLSLNERVKYGQDAEPLLISLFALQYADKYDVKTDKNAVYLKDGHQFASLDAELTDLETRARGILEVKTVVADSSAVWNEWDGKVPDTYYIQVLHQLLVTGWQFAILNPEFRWIDKDGQVTTKTRRILIEVTDEIKEDMRILDEAEREFMDNVKRNVRPPLILPGI